MSSCISQGFVFYNSSVQDVLIEGTFSRLPPLWSGVTPVEYLTKSYNCDVETQDSLFEVKDYLSQYGLSIENTIDSIPISLIIHPGGYVPIASYSHFMLHPFRNINGKRKPLPFLRPMSIIVKDTILFDSFEMEIPFTLDPLKFKEVGKNLIVYLEYRGE